MHKHPTLVSDPCSGHRIVLGSDFVCGISIVLGSDLACGHTYTCLCKIYGTCYRASQPCCLPEDSLFPPPLHTHFINPCLPVVCRCENVPLKTMQSTSPLSEWRLKTKKKKQFSVGSHSLPSSCVAMTTVYSRQLLPAVHSLHRMHVRLAHVLPATRGRCELSRSQWERGVARRSFIS